MVAFQRKPHWCGIASVQAALRALQIKRSQQTLASRCDTIGGCSEDEIKRLLLAEGLGVDEVTTESHTLARSWLVEHIDLYGPAVLCVDEWDHWVACIGRVADVFVIFDPSNEEANVNELGIRFYDWSGLKSRWLLPRREDGPLYYAIGCSS